MFISAHTPPPQVAGDASGTAPAVADLINDRADALGSEAAQEEASAEAKMTVLDRTPVEVLVQVFIHLDLATAHSLAATNRRFAGIFAVNRTSIVLHIAEVEFSPFSGLLQAVKASPADTCFPWGTWLNKRIIRNTTVLCPGSTVPETYAKRIPGPKIACAEARLDDADIDQLLSVCRVVRGWERVYPQHRFIAAPSTARSLTPTEKFRLRRALYTWMRYAYYFHGDLPRPTVYIPGGRDIRMNQLRALSNTELSELKDLWVTVENIVELSVCPSIDNVRIGADYQFSEKDAARIGWGKAHENRFVVATMRKLSPKELLFYLDNAHKYTKVRLIQDVRQRHPRFEADIESLSDALSAVIHERWRQMLIDLSATPAPAEGARAGAGRSANPLSDAQHMPVFASVSDARGGGILDWGSHEAEAEVFCTAASEMTGLGLDWRPEDSFFASRPLVSRGLLNP